METNGPTEKQLKSWSRGNKPLKPLETDGLSLLYHREINILLKLSIARYIEQSLPCDAYRCIDTDGNFSVVFSGEHLRKAQARFTKDPQSVLYKPSCGRPTIDPAAVTKTKDVFKTSKQVCGGIFTVVILLSKWYIQIIQTTSPHALRSIPNHGL